ncbi:MAG TPA: VWA domain-containing protein [Planctomycetota bacterium]
MIAADVSASIFDLSTQNVRLRELLKEMDPSSLEVAVAVFGANSGTERLMGPLAAPSSGLPENKRTADSRSPLPDLTRPTAVVERSGTDIGAAIDYSRGLFPSEQNEPARGILLLSDFRNTRGSPNASIAGLAGAKIDLLPSPAVLGASSDAYIAALRAPESGPLGRALPIEVTIGAQSPCTVRVALWRQKAGAAEVAVDFKTVSLRAEAGVPGNEVRQVVRFIDQPDSPGVALYTARLSGVDGDLPGDISSNNRLSTAVRVLGPSRWAVLTRSGSTLDRLARDSAKSLGVECAVYDVNSLPQSAAAYENCAGILVDGLSATELPQPALTALSGAVESGKALLAVGGEKAFGAGAHHDGEWERLLPVEMTPEDDRTRSVLFLIDVSKSMDQKMGASGSGVRKIDFAAEQLALAVQKLKPLDRVGLITFSGSAQLAAPLSLDSSHAAFLSAVKKIDVQANTDLLAPLKKAQDVLRDDDAEEQLVVLLSDGVQTASTSSADILAAARELCRVAPASVPAGRDTGATPRRTTLFTFGIGVDAQDADPTGEKMLKELAQAGGGTYSPDFLKLAQRLEQAFESQKKDFFVRRENFAPRAAYIHPLLPVGEWPVLPFRNRVRAKPNAETILGSAVAPASAPVVRRPDPLLVLSGPEWPGTSRRAVLALSLDGAAGSALLASPAGQRLLPAVLEWLESRGETQLPGWTVEAQSNDDDTLAIEVKARDPVTKLPLSGKNVSALLSPLFPAQDGSAQTSAAARVPLHPSAPGVYRTLLAAPAQGVYRLSILEDNRVLHERFVTIPFPAELRRFGTDRAAMQQLATLAGGHSRVIESPRDLAQWAAERQTSRERYVLAPWLIGLALALLLAEYAARR